MTDQELSTALHYDGYVVPVLAIKLFPVKERIRVEKWLAYIHRPVVAKGQPCKRPQLLERYASGLQRISHP